MPGHQVPLARAWEVFIHFMVTACARQYQLTSGPVAVVRFISTCGVAALASNGGTSGGVALSALVAALLHSDGGPLATGPLPFRSQNSAQSRSASAPSQKITAGPTEYQSPRLTTGLSHVDDRPQPRLTTGLSHHPQINAITDPKVASGLQLEVPCIPLQLTGTANARGEPPAPTSRCNHRPDSDPRAATGKRHPPWKSSKACQTRQIPGRTEYRARYRYFAYTNPLSHISVTSARPISTRHSKGRRIIAMPQKQRSACNKL